MVVVYKEHRLYPLSLSLSPSPSPLPPSPSLPPSLPLKGTSLIVVSPTLLDLADHVDSSISALAGLLLVRSFGALIGSVASGFVCDRHHQYNLWMLVASILASAVGESSFYM